MVGDQRQDASFHSWINVWRQVKLCDPLLTGTILSALEISIDMTRCYTCVLYNLLILMNNTKELVHINEDLCRVNSDTFSSSELMSIL